MKEFEYSGKYLKAVREAEGVTQREIAKKLDFVSGQFVSNAERGLCTLPPKALRYYHKKFKNFNKDFFISMIITDEAEKTMRHYAKVFRGKRTKV
jgi:transcriptional regulator with XRE-family HTH domain